MKSNPITQGNADCRTQKDRSRITLCITRKQERRLGKMGRVEKRCFAGFHRKKFDSLLDEWYQAHPQA